MNKPGRNDLCHCGSGKKYKKCCLQKDEAAALVDFNNNQETSEWLDDDEYHVDKDKSDAADIAFGDDEDKDILDEFDDDRADGNYEGKLGPEYEDYPEIGEEENKKVDEWWDAYKKLEDPNEIIPHIRNFLDNNRIEVSINLGLEHEVLFEMVEASLKAGIIDKGIELLLYIREKFPEIYIRSAGYFDYDVITWLCTNNRTDEIGNYLNYFEDYPLEWTDKLYEVVDFLLALGIDKALIPLTKKVCGMLWHSCEVMNGDTISTIPFNEIVVNYLGKEVQDGDLEEMMQKIKAIGLEFNDRVYDPQYWKSKFEAFNRPFEKWDEDIPKKKGQFIEKMTKISENYSRYLFLSKKLSFHVANHYASFLYNFYIYLIKQGKVPKQLFKLSLKEIDKTITDLTRDFIGIKVPICMTILNTLVMFGEYLEQCGNYSNEDKNEMLIGYRNLHQLIYDSHKDFSYDTRAFEKFPLF
jgi:hypothetical protein